MRSAGSIKNSIENPIKNEMGVHYGYSEKTDGNMAFKYGAEDEVIKARSLFLKKRNLALEDCVAMRLEHNDGVVLVGGGDKGKGALDDGGIVADALITKERGIILFLFTADCLPVAYYDPRKKAVGLVHLG